MNRKTGVDLFPCRRQIAEDLKAFDAVVDAFGAWTEETLPQHSTSLQIHRIS